MVKKVMMNFDLSKASGPECITVLVLKNCEPENFNYILHWLILTNEVLPHSWQMICFREFKVLTFKIVCIFCSEFKVVFWLNGLENFNCLKNFSNPFGAFTNQFSWISHYKTFPNSYFIFHVDSKKTQNYMHVRNLQYWDFTWPICCNKGGGGGGAYFSIIGKNIIDRGLNTEVIGLENEYFCNEDTLENSSYIFSSYNVSIIIFQTMRLSTKRYIL